MISYLRFPFHIYYCAKRYYILSVCLYLCLWLCLCLYGKNISKWNGNQITASWIIIYLPSSSRFSCTFMIILPYSRWHTLRMRNMSFQLPFVYLFLRYCCTNDAIAVHFVVIVAGGRKRGSRQRTCCNGCGCHSSRSKNNVKFTSLFYLFRPIIVDDFSPISFVCQCFLVVVFCIFCILCVSFYGKSSRFAT